MVAHVGNGEMQGAGERLIRRIVGDRNYMQTVITLANCVTFPRGEQYSIMVTQAAFDNIGIVLRHDFTSGGNDFQETSRKILRSLVCAEAYISLVDHADMHHQEGCSCAGCA